MKEQPKLEIIYLPISSLVKLPGNPRKDTDPEAINKLAVLINAHGFQNPLQVFKENGKYTIIAGNHRFDAGLTLSMTEFPCLIYTGDKKAALARAISDNKANTWTDWDFPMLKDMFTELDDAGDFDMFMTGFAQFELNNIFGIVGNDPNAEWNGMPEFEQQDQLAKYSVRINFLNENDLKSFAVLIQQKITMNTKSVWYPEQKTQSRVGEVFQSEP